ncbi:hypothetical protein V6N13_126917 [Hibiscus sabdariffa]
MVAEYEHGVYLTLGHYRGLSVPMSLFFNDVGAVVSYGNKDSQAMRFAPIDQSVETPLSPPWPESDCYILLPQHQHGIHAICLKPNTSSRSEHKHIKTITKWGIKGRNEK